MENPSLIINKSASGLARASIKFSARALLAPIDYTRTRELPVLLSLCGILDKKDIPLKILDISSPQLLSMSLAHYSPLWEVTYINPFMPEIDNMEQRKALLNLRNLNIQKADITDPDIHRKLTTYDLIISCSVFEHIHPEYGGDILASKKISGLLRTGGKFILSVPYYKNGFHEYKSHPEYDSESDNNHRVHFFQRFYDETTLHQQIIAPTGLTLDKIEYLGERYFFPNNIKKRFTHLVSGKLPMVFLGRLYPVLSRIFMCRCDDPDRLKKPYLAFVSMRKTISPNIDAAKTT